MASMVKLLLRIQSVRVFPEPLIVKATPIVKLLGLLVQIMLAFVTLVFILAMSKLLFNVILPV